jgi:predicted metal-dependent phosphotriesterase family hydrolase
MQTNPISRRRFAQTLAVVTAGFYCRRGIAAEAAAQIMTVLGPINPQELGPTLSHEHGVVDFIGAEKAAGPRYDVEEAFKTILPHLKQLKEHGCRSFVECTPNYIGRNVTLLKRLSQASGLHILTNTGYYGAAANKFLPKHFYAEDADALATRWVNEWKNGIEGNGIRPGFIKLGVDKGKLPDPHVKLVRAGAKAHLQSGLTIAIHTGNGEAALDELRVLTEERVAPNALIWVHAQNGAGPLHVEVAKRGAWVSLDGYSTKNHQRYKDWLMSLKQEKLLNRVLLSHDHFWSVQGEGDNGKIKLSSGSDSELFQSIFTRLLPDLRMSGFSQAEIDQLMVVNPREAFTIRVRAL